MSVAGQFAALDMASLIGGPLNAAANAQGQLASITTEFIQNVGLQDDGNGNLSARTVDFKYDKPFKVEAVEAVDAVPAQPAVAADPVNGIAAKPAVPAVAAVAAVPAYWDKVSLDLQVPLLTIVKAPNLQVKEVNVQFDMEVKTSSSSSNETQRDASLGVSYKGWGAKVDFKASVSNTQKSQRSSDTSAKYHVDVKALDEGAPEGLMKVLDILGEAIQPADG